MQINWFTVIAQIINFLILVWLLKRFLYKPVLNAIDEREKRITGQLKDADDKKAAATKEQEDFTKKNADFNQQKKALMDQAVADTNTQRDKLFEEAKNEADILRANLEKTSKENQENLNLAMAKTTQMQVFAITRKALTDIASSNLEEQSVNTFTKRLHELNDEEKKKFINAFQSNSNTILVRSAFELSLQQQTEITTSVNELLATKSLLQFTTEPELISGIELITNGYKLAWSFSEYLNSLQNNISETTKETPKKEPEMNGVAVNN